MRGAEESGLEPLIHEAKAVEVDTGAEESGLEPLIHEAKAVEVDTDGEGVG